MITITINTGNDAFQGCMRLEVVHVLEELVSRLKQGKTPTKTMDCYGNSVGTVDYTDDSVQMDNVSDRRHYRKVKDEDHG